MQVHRRARLVLDLLALQLADGLLEQLHVHLEADRLDVAALLAAEQVARAANLEVERRHAEPAAEVGELADGREPLPRHRRQRVARRDQQVRVGRPVGPPDAPAQLVELRQAVAVGAVDDDRVDVRDVEAVLDDRRGEQHVELARDEVDHRPLELVLAHLAVADDDPRLGHEPREQVADRVDRLDAVVDEVDLAAARQLVADDARDERLVEAHDVGLDGEAVLRRRLDDRHVADADERHVQRPRDRRRGHRQHVHLAAHLLDALLVRDAEPLLLVHDQQAEVLEDDVLRQQAVRADDDVHLAGGQVGERLLDLAASCGTG